MATSLQNKQLEVSAEHFNTILNTPSSENPTAIDTTTSPLDINTDNIPVEILITYQYTDGVTGRHLASTIFILEL